MDTEKKLSLEILELIKTAQAQNGLRHNDYSRYHYYCTRKLRRLRSAKTIDFTHAPAKGQGKKGSFAQNELTPEVVTDPRHLMIALFNSERAWAQAMEIQQEEGTGEKNADSHSHLLSRLRKAAKWAVLLQDLCLVRCDARSGLEAEAYCAWIKSSLSLVTSDWQGGLEHLGRCSAIYSQLKEVAAHRRRELFAARLLEIEPTERYCRYQAMRKLGKKASEAAAASATLLGSESVDLKNKIDQAISEHQIVSLQGGDGVSAIAWRRTLLPVRSEKLRKGLAAAQDKASQLASILASLPTVAASTDGTSVSPGMNVNKNTEIVTAIETSFLELFSLYDDVSKVALIEAARLTRIGQEAQAADNVAIDGYAKFLRLRYQYDRHLISINNAAALFYTAEANAKNPTTGIELTTSSSIVIKKSHMSKKRKIYSKALGISKASNPMALSSVWNDSFLHRVLSKSAKHSENETSGISAIEEAVAASALEVVQWCDRAKNVIEEMNALAGGNDTEAVTTVKAAIIFPVDSDLLTCIQARRHSLLAWRAFFLALSFQHRRRFVDSADLMKRAEERSNAASEAYSECQNVKQGTGIVRIALPLLSLFPDAPQDATTSVLSPPVYSRFALSGVSQNEVSALTGLQTLSSRRSIAIRAAGLLESLAPSIRTDANVTHLYFNGLLKLSGEDSGKSKSILPTQLERSNRVQTLVERESFASTLSAVGEAPGDVMTISHHPAASQPLVALPVKPIVLDLAFAGVPEPVETPAAATTTSASGGGIFSSFFGGSSSSK
jgi:hypothetical protein